MAIAYLATAYLAPVQYYCKLCTAEHAVVDGYEHYVKQSYRNRCLVAGAGGVQQLSVPVEHTGGDRRLTKDVRIAAHGRWQQQHWQTFVSAYGTSPFFDYYQDDFAPFYRRTYTFLFDFNEALREMICSLIGCSPTVRYSTRYEDDVPENDFRCAIRPKHAATDDAFRPCPYYQVFADRHGFVPNLSIVDLLFNMGTETLVVLNNSVRNRSATA